MTSTLLLAAVAEPSAMAAFVLQTVPFVLIFGIFYILTIRPQQRRMRAHQALIAAVKKGDEVITAGGIRGRVTKVGDDEAEVEIAQGVRVRVVKGTLSQVVVPNAKPAND